MTGDAADVTEDAAERADECAVDTDCACSGEDACSSVSSPQRAIPKSQLTEAERNSRLQPTVCQACAEQTDPLAPFWVAGCVAKHCQLVDVRAQDITRCDSDDDCVARGRGCCGPYSSDLSEYFGVRRDADLTSFACFPQPPCLAPPEHVEQPVAFCASDGHCAVRRGDASE